MRNTLISNEFTGHRNWAKSQFQAFAREIYNYMPHDYFANAQAPIIRIEYPYTVYTANYMSHKGMVRSTFLSNSITDNLHT